MTQQIVKQPNPRNRYSFTVTVERQARAATEDEPGSPDKTTAVLKFPNQTYAELVKMQRDFVDGFLAGQLDLSDLMAASAQDQPAE